MQGINLKNPLKIDVTDYNINLEKTFNCGQCFRWNYDNQTNTWRGIVRNKVYWIREKEENGRKFIETTASKSEWNKILFTYLDLDTVYEDELDIPNSDKFAINAQNAGRGIKILRQEPWETLISFIISQRNNIPKIKSTIERLCKAYGKKLEVYNENGKQYPSELYGFPSASVLASLDISDLENLGLGYRDEYILNAAKAVDNDIINLDELTFSQVNGNKAVEQLMTLKGVGPKVANCVALFGLHKLDMFPIDVWIQRIIDTYYNGNINIESYGKLAGVVQQYMFYYIKFNSGGN